MGGKFFMFSKVLITQNYLNNDLFQFIKIEKLLNEDFIDEPKRFCISFINKKYFNINSVIDIHLTEDNYNYFNLITTYPLIKTKFKLFYNNIGGNLIIYNFLVKKDESYINKQLSIFEVIENFHHLDDDKSDTFWLESEITNLDLYTDRKMWELIQDGYEDKLFYSSVLT